MGHDDGVAEHLAMARLPSSPLMISIERPTASLRQDLALLEQVDQLLEQLRDALGLLGSPVRTISLPAHEDLRRRTPLR